MTKEEQEPRCTWTQVTSALGILGTLAAVRVGRWRPRDPKLSDNINAASFAPRAGEASDIPVTTQQPPPTPFPPGEPFSPSPTILPPRP